MENNKFICQYCGRELKNANSLRNHERLCKQNPNKQEMYWLAYGGFSKYNEKLKTGEVKRKPSNQYIKSNELGLPKPEMTDETKFKCGNGWRGKTHTPEQIQQLSNTMQKVVQNNPNYSYSATSKRFKKSIYKGFHMDSSWELIFAQYLDKFNIKWVKNSKGFKYIWENRERTYYPDFYLEDYNLYIEIKGHESERDRAKYEALNNLITLYSDTINLIINNNFDIIKFLNEHFNFNN